MGKENKLFQYIILAVFIFLGVVSVLVFSLYRASSNTANLSSITVWGTVNAGAVSATIAQLKEQIPALNKVTYTQLSSTDYEGQLTQAFAESRGPDLYLLDQSLVMSEYPKLTPISYTTLTEREYRDTFFDAADAFLFGAGTLALPLIADPLVMYWNKDTFADAGLVEPPKYWDEFFVLAPKITKRTGDGKITKSFVALGDYDNVTHAKEILSALMFAAGSPITRWGANSLESALLINTNNAAGSPAEAALRFYTEFSNPIKTAYSWHKAMPYSRDAFLSGDLAIYFGFASEAQDIRTANPNLNFDIALLPQSRLAPRRTTYARVLALAVPKTSRDPARAYQVARALTSQQASLALSTQLGLAPVRRDILNTPPTSAYWATVYQSAIIAKTWLEPSPSGVATAFARMVDAVISGRATAQTAASTADGEFRHLLE